MVKIFFLVAVVSLWLPARYLGSYTARLGGNDHYSSRGAALYRAADVLQQDRANYHRFGLRDPEDTGDGYFTTRSHRARMGRMLRRGWIEPGLAREIVERTPVVHVDIYSRHIEVRRVSGSPPPVKDNINPPFPQPLRHVQNLLKKPDDVKYDALRRLQTHARSSDFGFQTHQYLKHRIIAVLPCKEVNTDTLWVLAESRPVANFDCHACVPVQSLFKYRRNGNTWELMQQRYAIDKIGGWGTGPDAKDTALVRISPSQCAVAIRSGYASQGWVLDHYTLLGPTGHGLGEIFFTTLSVDNGGVGEGPQTSWSTKIRLRPGTGEYYLIHLQRQGIAEGQPVNYAVSYFYRRGKYFPNRPDPLARDN